MTILFFSDIVWDSLFQRPQHIARRLAHHASVLWIEPAVLGYRRFWRPAPIAPGLHRLTLPLLPHNAKDRRIRTAARWASALPPVRSAVVSVQRFLLRRAMRRLAIDPAEVKVVLQNFQFITLARSMQPSRLLFDYIDDAFGFTRYPAYVRNDWRSALRHADVITATTQNLIGLIRQEQNRVVVLVPNGVDVHAYPSERPGRPDDLPLPGRPLALYAGTIASWFDFDLVASLARHVPETDIVLIGPVHPDVAAAADRLRSFPNCTLLPAKPHALIPHYLAYADAGLIPFLRNTLTASVNPVKLYEYSAAGIPAVTTSFSTDLEAFREIISIAATPEEFIRQVRSVLSLPPPEKLRLREKLRTFAEANTWDMRAETLLHLLEHPSTR